MKNRSERKVQRKTRKERNFSLFCSWKWRPWAPKKCLKGSARGPEGVFWAPFVGQKAANMKKGIAHRSSLGTPRRPRMSPYCFRVDFVMVSDALEALQDRCLMNFRNNFPMEISRLFPVDSDSIVHRFCIDFGFFLWESFWIDSGFFMLYDNLW